MIKVKMIDSGGGVGYSTFEDATSSAALDTYLATYSGCGVYSAVQITPQAGVTPTVPQADSNLDRKLKIHYKNMSTFKRLILVLPSPTATGTVGKHGERLSLAQAQAVLDAWKTANAITDVLVATRGTFIQTK